MSYKIIFVFLIEGQSRDFQPKNERMKNKTDRKLVKRTLIDQFGPETSKTDHDRPIWARNYQNGPRSTNLGPKLPKRTMIDRFELESRK